MEPHDIDLVWGLSKSEESGEESYRDVGPVTPEVCKLYGGQQSVAGHLERSTVLHHELDQALAGGDVGHQVLLQVYILQIGESALQRVQVGKLTLR